MQRPVVRVSCGYSHTGCIVAGGEVLGDSEQHLYHNITLYLELLVSGVILQLFMWGSTTNGKCGLGPVVSTEECYSSVPTRIMVGPEDRRVKKYFIYIIESS